MKKSFLLLSIFIFVLSGCSAYSKDLPQMEDYSTAPFDSVQADDTANEEMDGVDLADEMAEEVVLDDAVDVEQSADPVLDPFVGKYFIRTAGENESTDRYYLDVKYPQFDNPDDVESLTIINEKIEDAVNVEITSLKDETAFTDTLLIDINLTSSLYIGYDYTITEDDIFSLELTHDRYSAGAAHPNLYVETYNYDLNSGDEVELMSVFNEGVDWYQALEYLITEDVKRQNDEIGWGMEDEYLEEQIQEEGIMHYLIQPDQLVVLYNPYEITPYAIGSIRVEIPYKALGILMK